MFTISQRHLKHFKGFCFPPDIIMLFVYMKLRFSLSYRDLEEIMEIRGLCADHATIKRWVDRFSSLIAKVVSKSRKPVQKSWRMDETYIKVKGKWCYLYRAVDSTGQTVDFLFRAQRDGVAAKAFFKKAISNNGKPEKITIDKSGSNIHAINDLNENYPQGGKIEMRQIKYLNNIVEQDHRFIKKRVRPMLGFKSFYSAKRILAGIEGSAHDLQKTTSQLFSSIYFYRFFNFNGRIMPPIHKFHKK